jgi:predicted small secreted protein
MKKITAALLLAALSLAAPAQGLKDRTPVTVSVSGGQITDPGDVHTSADEGALVWVLASKGYRFAEGTGIDIKSAGQHACRTLLDGQRVRCAKSGHRRGDRFKYEINLIGADGQLLNLDPFILND